MKNKNKITVVSHHFPSERQPYLQPFLTDHIEAIKKTNSFIPELLHIHPKMIPFTKRWKNYRSPLLTDVPYSKQSYFSFPAKKAPNFVANQFSSAVRNQISPEQNKLLHLHWLYPGGIALPKLKEAGFTCVLTIHGSDWFLNKHRSELRKLFIDAIFAADKVFTSGPTLRDEIQELVDSKKEIISLFNYIDTEKFSIPTGELKKTLKSKFNWDSNLIHVLTVANIRHEKGIDILLKAISEAPSNLRFHIIGQADHSAYTASIKEKITELNADDKKVFLHPPVPREELVNYYQAADFFILPSRSEGFNVSLLEALACGLPVISGNTGGANLVIDSSNGMIFEPGDHNTLIKKISDMSQQFSNYDSRLLHKFISEKYSLETYAENLQEQYQKLL